MTKRYLLSLLIPRDIEGGRAMDADFAQYMPIHLNIKEKGDPINLDDLHAVYRLVTYKTEGNTLIIVLPVKQSGMTFEKAL